MKPTRLIALLLAALLTVLLFGGCSPFGGEKDDESSSSEAETEPTEPEPEPDPEYPVEAGGTTLLSRPGRVVSLAPSLTEKLYDMGLESRLAGISDYCDYPEEITGLPLCGTAMLPDVDAILAQDAHLVLTESELPDEAVALLEEADVTVAVLPHATSVEELLNVYIDLAALLDGDISGRAMGESFADFYTEGLAEIEDAVRAQPEEALGKKVLYLRLMDYTVATGDTFENELLELIGLDNIAKDYTDWAYPEEAAASPDGVAAFASVDVIYMDKEFVTITDLEQSPFYKGLPATINDRYLYIECIEMERQSLRTLDLLGRMAGYVYPNEEVVEVEDAA
jgi:iron complex transport system substrate-binding protein